MRKGGRKERGRKEGGNGGEGKEREIGRWEGREKKGKRKDGEGGRKDRRRRRKEGRNSKVASPYDPTLPSPTGRGCLPSSSQQFSKPTRMNGRELLKPWRTEGIHPPLLWGP